MGIVSVDERRQLSPVAVKGSMLVAIVLIIGIVVIVTSVRMGHAWNAADLVYELGVGVLIATGVSAAVGVYLTMVEERHRSREAAIAERMERTERAQAQQWDVIEADLARLGRDMDRASVELAIGNVENEVKVLEIRVGEVHDDIRQIRQKVDPRYVHPHKPLVDALVAKLESMVRRESAPDRVDHPAAHAGSSSTPTGDQLS